MERKKSDSCLHVEKVSLKTKDENILMEYLPEDLIDWPFPHESTNEDTRKKRESWWENWAEYMHENKRTSYGKHLCQSCIIHPDAAKYSTSIYDVIMKGIDVKSPCQVVNYFTCPHAEKNDVLFGLKNIFEITEKAISHTKQLSWGRKYTYFVDFEKNRGEGYLDLYAHGRPNFQSDVNGLLERLEISKVILETVDDLYGILTSEKSLGIVFDQYIQNKRKNEFGNLSESEITVKVKELEYIKSYTISYLASIKSSISIEEFRKSNDSEIQQEKKEVEWYKSHYKRSAEDEPRIRENQTRPKNGICMNCSGFANILCVNCNKWICDIHWRDHREKFHNKNGSAAST